MKKVYLTPKENEVIIASEFIVIKDYKLVDNLMRVKKPPKSLASKLIIVAPDGIMFAKREVLEEALKYQKK